MVIREKESEAGTRGTKGTGLACGNATINLLGMRARRELVGQSLGPGSGPVTRLGLLPPAERRIQASSALPLLFRSNNSGLLDVGLLH